MESYEILNRFNFEGIFPTNEELHILAEDSNDKEKILDVELYLLKIAEQDASYPYHHMTQPITKKKVNE